MSGSVQVDDGLKQTIDLPAMEINHLPSAIGYGFALSTQSANLKGQPWDSKVSVMRLRDKNAKRKKGERPEVRIEVHCLREDLHIEEISFTDKKMTVWSKLTKSKRIAVEQFIKDELSKAGPRMRRHL